MTKFKKLIVASLLLCCAVCACLFASFASCVTPKPEDNAVKYTVTVKLDETTFASGVGVQIGKGSAKFEKKTTDANGKVEFELAPDSYDVSLSTLPAHYGVPEDASLSLTEESRNLTVTLAKNFAYTVKLVNPDGTPYYAADVQIVVCTLEGNCFQGVDLEEGGVAFIEDALPIQAIKSGSYHVKVEGLPANAKFECDTDGYYTGENFAENATEMTIKVTTVESVNAAAPMTSAEKTAYAKINAAYTADVQKYEARKITKQVAAKGTVFFSVTPEISGIYHFYKDGKLRYLTNGTEFSDGEAGNYFPLSFVFEAKKTYFFKAINDGAATATAEFVMTTPFSSYIEHEGVGGILDLTVGKENTNAVVAFTPRTAGVYNLTVQGEALTVVKTYNSQPDEFLTDVPANEEYAAKASIEASVSAKAATGGTVVYFAVAVKADSYPAEVNVVIKKTADVSETYKYAEVKEELTQYTKPEGKELHGVALDGTATLVYNADDKFYHLGTADGPVVVVNLTGSLDSNRFEAGCSLAYMELVDSRLATYAVDVTEEGATTTSILDYTLFLRGFEKYDYENSMLGLKPVIPKKITTEVYYAKYVNEDGVYPLTQELKQFLERFYAANAETFEWQLPMDADLKSAWLFPCYYYGEASESDAIVGKYKFVKNVMFGDVMAVGDEKIVGWDEAKSEFIKCTVGDDEYKLVVDKRGSFTIYGLSEGDYSEDTTGTWSKDEKGNYTFTVPNGTQDPETYEMVDLVYTVTFDAKAGTIKLVGADESEWEFKL